MNSNTSRTCTFQIGQCRITVDLQRTKQFYSSLPRITDNCKCGYCQHYEKDIISKSNPFFDVLKRMNVDLSRQPNINPDGISCVGETKPGKLEYLGYYFVYGHLGKTSKKNSLKDMEGNLEKVEFNNREFGADMQVTIQKVDHEKLSFEFYMQVAD